MQVNFGDRETEKERSIYGRYNLSMKLEKEPQPQSNQLLAQPNADCFGGALAQALCVVVVY